MVIAETKIVNITIVVSALGYFKIKPPTKKISILFFPFVEAINHFYEYCFASLNPNPYSFENWVVVVNLVINWIFQVLNEEVMVLLYNHCPSFRCLFWFSSFSFRFWVVVNLVINWIFQVLMNCWAKSIYRSCYFINEISDR